MSSKKRSPRLKSVDGQKFCHQCKEWKPLKKFPSRGPGRARTSPCTACLFAKSVKRRSEEHKRWRAKQGDDYYAKQALHYRYGISIEERDELIKQQHYRCAICETPIDDKAESKYERPVVDHNHETDLVRGILCRSCNSGLGMFTDSPEKLMRARDYLLHHKQRDDDLQQRKLG